MVTRVLGLKDVLCSLCGVTFQGKRSDGFCPDCHHKHRLAAYQKHDRKRRKSTCPRCGGNKTFDAGMCKSCRTSVRQVGAHNPNWKGGKTSISGYVYVRASHPRNHSVYQAEHLLVWEAAHGPIPADWVVHHLNGIKTDNRLENLAAMGKGEHHRHPCRAYEERIRFLEARIRQLEGLPS